jgi:ubiquinone/menaquinone biosynthesis C-methylase UbiE
MTDHEQTVIEQFSRQSIYFAKLLGHEESTQLLLQMAGVGSENKVLDVACGAGGVALAAAQVARQVTGIDLTPAMITQAEAKQRSLELSNVNWQVGDVARLPFQPELFDVVLTRYSFHHFLDPSVVMNEMVRVCRRGGRVAVADLTLPTGKAEAYDIVERLRDPSHVRVLSDNELLELFARAGLTGVQSARYQFELNLDQLLEASFPPEGNTERVRANFEADIGRDRLGLNIQRVGENIQFAYPIAVLVGTKVT